MSDNDALAFLEPLALQQRMDESEAMAPLLRAHSAAGTRLQTAQANELEALAPFTQQHKAALTRLDLAQATKLETENEGEKRAAAMMANGLSEGGSTGKMSDALLKQAEVYYKSGLPVKGNALLQSAAAQQSHEATAENQKAALAQRKLEQQIKLGDEFANALDPEFVYDQPTWERVNSRFEKKFSRPSPYADMPFSPELVASIRSQALGIKDKAMLEIHQQNLERQTKAVEGKIRHDLVQEAVAALRAKTAEEAEDRRAKAGGKDVGYPSQGEITAAEELLRGDPVTKGVTNLNQASFAIASEARLLRKQSNGTLSAEEAMTRALEAKRASGELAPGKSGFFTGTKPSYSPAIPLPASGKLKDMVVGKLYKNDDGVVKRWTGKGNGWEKVTAAPTSPPPRSSPSDDAFGDPP